MHQPGLKWSSMVLMKQSLTFFMIYAIEQIYRTVRMRSFDNMCTYFFQ